MSSSARRRWAASRSRRNASEYLRSLLRSACSARLRSVTSTMSPRSCLGPWAPRTTCTRSRSHRVLPWEVITRYSTVWSCPASMAARLASRAASRSAAAMCDPQVTPWFGHPAASAPRMSSNRPPRNVNTIVAGSASQNTASRLSTNSWKRSSSESRRAFPRAREAMSDRPRAYRRSRSSKASRPDSATMTNAPNPSGSQSSGAIRTSLASSSNQSSSGICSTSTLGMMNGWRWPFRNDSATSRGTSATIERGRRVPRSISCTRATRNPPVSTSRT